MLFLLNSLLIYNGQFQKMSDLKSKLTKKGGQKIKMKVHLFKVMILALSASPATPVAVFVVGKVIEGLL